MTDNVSWDRYMATIVLFLTLYTILRDAAIENLPLISVGMAAFIGLILTLMFDYFASHKK